MTVSSATRPDGTARSDREVDRSLRACAASWDYSTRLLDERDQVGREALGLFPVQRMAGALVDEQLGAGDAFGERILVGAWSDDVLVAPDDEGGSGDALELDGPVDLQQAREAGAPHGRGQLQALAHDHVDETVSDRLRDRALLELEHELGVDAVVDGLDRLADLDDDRVVA